MNEQTTNCPVCQKSNTIRQEVYSNNWYIQSLNVKTAVNFN